jgi:PEP-CTERM motif-containing protein
MRHLSSAFLTCLILGSLAVGSARADTITFVDTSNTITVTHDGSDHTVALFNTQTSSFGSCSADETFQCDVFISSPAGATTASPPTSLNIAEAGVDPTLAVSDYLDVPTIEDSPSYLVIFASDRPNDPSSTIGLTPIPGPVTTETGGVQTAFTLSWTDGTSDTIRFQSDLDPVPEPGTLTLFGSGILSLVGLARKRLFI